MRYTKLVVLIFTSSFLGLADAKPVAGSKMIAAGPSAEMVAAVKDIAQSGGNVVDAAVAAALTLAVTSPYYAALGGGGFAMLKMGESVEALDFRETAPAATDKSFYEKKSADSSTIGGAAVGVPGVPAGLWALHKKYGKLSWKRLFQYPLKLAQEGFNLSGEWTEITAGEKEAFTKAGKKYFFKNGATDYKPGEVLKQIALAQALIEFRNKGEEGFYRGAIAQDISKSVANAGGVITLEDLKNYKVRWLEPISTEFHGYKIFMMPPPSSGGVVMKSAFYLIEKLQLQKHKYLSVEELHLLGEILNRSFRGRGLLGDPDFNKNPLTMLFSPAYLNEMASSIHADKANQLAPLKEAANEKMETTHFSIADNEGHAIAFTVTLNGEYGSKVVSERFGIALNNEMDDFTTRPGVANQFGLIQGSGNMVAPGKRPLSSMSPTLVEKSGKVVLAVGAPGGPRIISAVLQTIYRNLVTELDIDEAIQAPRVHNQFLPNKLFIDDLRLSPEISFALQTKGHVIEGGRIGKAYGVRVKDDGTLEGAFDSRGEGAAGGL